MSYDSPPSPPHRLRGALVALAVLAPVVGAGALAGYVLGDRVPWYGAEPAVAEPGTSGSTRSPTASAAVPGTPRAGGDTDLTGTVVVIDPGHNPSNREHTSKIARLVDIGPHKKECDTVGAATNSGYPEATFTLDVARRLRTLLEEQGATVEFTQDDDVPYGPCVDERARIGNHAHADAVVSVHADGASRGQRGFHVIAPATVRQGKADTSGITAPSRALAKRLITAFATATGSEPADYVGGGDGLTVRNDLGGLNLSTVPKVFIECGNMRDPQDAAQLTNARWRERAARGIAEGITDFLLNDRKPIETAP